MNYRRSVVGAAARAAMAGLCVWGVAACGGDDPSGGGATTSATTSAAVTSPPPAGSSTAPAATSAPAPSATTTTDPPSAEGWPPYESSIGPVTAARLGSTWRPGCPVGPEDLSLLQLSYATPDGASATGELVVATAAASDVVDAFGELYAARFPITQMTTIDAYGADDDLSMAADNTSAFNCRPVTGGEGWSRHSYGLAIDINPLLNPYVQDDLVLPPAGRAYLDRSDVRPGMIVAGDLVVKAFGSRGFRWGGDFETLKDYQHFDR